MYVFGDDGFVPEHFEILEFYEQQFLVAWRTEQMVLCPFENVTERKSRRLVTAPRPVRRVQSFAGRIFVTCVPSGVYKLSRKYQFALLSNSAIGTGCKFYQVIRVVDGYLQFYDKQDETIKMLIKQDPIDRPLPFTLGLNRQSTDESLFTALFEGPTNEDGLCIFSNGYGIYKILPDAVKILYSYIYPIRKIIEVKLNEITKYLIYVTNKNTMIIMYDKESQIVFETIHLNQQIKTVYASVDENSENAICMVHSDGSRTYKSVKILGKRSIHSTELRIPNLVCIRSMGSKIFGLTLDGKLLDLKCMIPENLVDLNTDEFIKLKHRMLEGTDSIVNAICDKVKELQIVDSQLLDEQNALKRINMFACKQRILDNPKFIVQKTGKKTMVGCNFGYAVPEKCQMTFAIQSKGRKIFTTKRVTQNETNIELPLPNAICTEELNVSHDLVTLSEEGYSWCLIKQCTKNTDHILENENADEKRKTFASAKLAVIRNLKSENTLDIAKLDAIKSNIRKEFNVN